MSGQHICPIFKSQETQEEFELFVRRIQTVLLDLYFDASKIRVLRKCRSHAFAVCGQPRRIDVMKKHRNLFVYNHWEGEEY